MMIQDTAVPVVVLKTEHYGGLGIMRSLGRLGVKVYSVEKLPHAPALRSRYCSGKFLWDIDSASPADSLARLQRIGERLPLPVLLVPTSDETTLFVAEHADTLRRWFIFPPQSPEVVCALSRKKEMYGLASLCRVPTPKTFFPRSSADVLKTVPLVHFPVLLKGINGWELEKRTGKKMVIVRDPRELMEKYEMMEDRNEPNLMIQEYIPGDEDHAWIYNGYFDAQSNPLVSFSGRKLRQNPVYTGMTSLGVTERNETVIELAERFMRSMGYCGIVDIDFRYDPRDAKYKILDVNPRVGATFRLFVGRNGNDVVRSMYLDMTHQPGLPTVQLENRKWIVEDKDMLSSYRYFKDGNLSFMNWLRSLRGIDEAGYFALDDPLPFFTMWLNHLIRRLARAFTRTPGMRVDRSREMRIPEQPKRMEPQFTESVEQDL